MKETTYQKYKRELKQLREIVGVDVVNFAIVSDRKEFQKRLNYLRDYIAKYRLHCLGIKEVKE